MDTVNSVSPLRQWVVNILTANFPPNVEYRSDTNGAAFTQWTNMTHEQLCVSWTNDSQYNKPLLTTCNAFLDVLVQMIRTAGTPSETKRFSSFMLPQNNPGWHWFPEPGRQPKPGDFFEIGHRGGSYKHVGVVAATDGVVWTTVEAGQGGHRVGHDSIKSKGPRIFPGKDFMGWLDIDEYFSGWTRK